MILYDIHTTLKYPKIWNLKLSTVEKTHSRLPPVRMLPSRRWDDLTTGFLLSKMAGWLLAIKWTIWDDDHDLVDYPFCGYNYSKYSKLSCGLLYIIIDCYNLLYKYIIMDDLWRIFDVNCPRRNGLFKLHGKSWLTSACKEFEHGRDSDERNRLVSSLEPAIWGSVNNPVYRSTEGGDICPERPSILCSS